MFTTIEERLETLASSRQRLAEHYATLAEGADCPRVESLLERLSDEEKQLAGGLKELAHGNHVALRSWVQFPRRLRPIPPRLPSNLKEVVGLSKQVDEAMLALCQPLKTAGSAAVREWSEALHRSILARGRNRSSLLALES